MLRFVAIASSLSAVHESATPDCQENKHKLTQAVVFSRVLFVRHIAVQSVGAHGLLRGGVGGKYKVSQEATIYVNYCIDEHIWAAYVTTRYVHRWCTTRVRTATGTPNVTTIRSNRLIVVSFMYLLPYPPPVLSTWPLHTLWSMVGMGKRAA